ncbi:MAG: PqqD family peptide modification chaperone [Acidobacteria bacterium]|nr:PqqD family peptide modification chaperone [Acidobacteriota bacterium]
MNDIELELQEGTTLERYNEIMTAEMGEELVMLHIDQGSYFGLDEIGREIWALLESPISFSGLCGKLSEQFDADAETLQTDVTAFLTRLARNDLVTVDGEKVA